MSWNEVKVGLAPRGSQIYLSRDRSTTTNDDYPVTVITVGTPISKAEIEVKATDLEAWLVARGFRFLTKKPQSSRLHLNEIEAVVGREGDLLREIMLNFLVELDVRARLQTWSRFVSELCENHRLQLIDPEFGLVDGRAFEGLVKQSYAWECFLKREAAQQK